MIVFRRAKVPCSLEGVLRAIAEANCKRPKRLPFDQALNIHPFHLGNFTRSPPEGRAKAHVPQAPIEITRQPESQGATPGVTVKFVVEAISAAPLAYQWRFNGVEISGRLRLNWCWKTFSPPEQETMMWLSGMPVEALPAA